MTIEIMLATVLNAVWFALILIEVIAVAAFGAGNAFAILDFIDAFAFRGDAFGLEALVFAADSAGAIGIALAFLLVVEKLTSSRDPAGLV